jgi:hypothetical protein
MLKEQQHYDYMPWRRRPKITWPGGARVIMVPGRAASGALMVRMLTT